MSLTELALEQVARPLRLRRNTAWIVAALGLAMLLLGVIAWLARLDVIRTLAWVPAAWIGAALLAACGGVGTASRGGGPRDSLTRRVAGAFGCVAPRRAPRAPGANAAGFEQ